MKAREAKRRDLIRHLLRSNEPSIRWRTRVRVLGQPRSSPAIRKLENEIRQSTRVRALLTRGFGPFRQGQFGGIYRYWQGIHWALASLVDLGYPPQDPTLEPLLDRALSMWLQPKFDRRAQLDSASGSASGTGVLVLRGRFRRCASQQRNAILYATRLGQLDDRPRHLADLLERWQWPDGGWNCARSEGAHTSSFMERLTPMRGLHAYGSSAGSREALRAAERAAEGFLQRRLFRRRSDGRVIRPDFVRLHYPLYWHYTVLGGLKGMAELGKISDPRCREALEWLQERELNGGGWPVDARYYRVSSSYQHGCEFVNWGQPRPRTRNDWVTTDALHVLRESGLWSPPGTGS